jgi:hypothetical protein
LSSDAGYFIDGSLEPAFVCLRRFVKTADFSHRSEAARISSAVAGGSKLKRV